MVQVAFAIRNRRAGDVTKHTKPPKA